MEENTVLGRKKGLTQVGFRYTCFAVVIIAVQLSVVSALHFFAPEFAEQNGVLLSFLLIIVSMDMIGFPLVWLLNRKLPAAELPQSDLGVGKFILGIFICAGITGVGAFIGTVLNMGLLILLGKGTESDPGILTLMLHSGFFMRMLTVGILAPIFEELIFRKVLVDHLAPYGKWVAVAASGLMFGLFHGNFSQCFFAAGLGFFFAYVYVKTGKIRYTIAYHMIVNLTTSVISVPIAAKYLSALESADMARVASGSAEALRQVLPAMMLLLGWVGVLCVCSLAGIVVFCVNIKKFKLPEEEGNPTFGRAVREIITSPGMLAFGAVCLFLFVKNYLLQ